MRVLLISNSGQPFLEHCRGELRQFYGPSITRVGFVSAATLADPEHYFVRAKDGLEPLGVDVNPHYKDRDPAMAPHSETREDRIREYHVRNKNAVVGIEEPTMVRVGDGTATVLGQGRVKLFQVGKPPRWFRHGETLPL